MTQDKPKNKNPKKPQPQKNPRLCFVYTKNKYEKMQPLRNRKAT